MAVEMGWGRADRRGRILSFSVGLLIQMSCFVLVVLGLSRVAGPEMWEDSPD